MCDCVIVYVCVIVCVCVCVFPADCSGQRLGLALLPIRHARVRAWHGLDICLPSCGGGRKSERVPGEAGSWSEYLTCCPLSPYLPLLFLSLPLLSAPLSLNPPIHRASHSLHSSTPVMPFIPSIPSIRPSLIPSLLLLYHIKHRVASGDLRARLPVPDGRHPRGNRPRVGHGAERVSTVHSECRSTDTR